LPWVCKHNPLKSFSIPIDILCCWWQKSAAPLFNNTTNAQGAGEAMSNPDKIAIVAGGVRSNILEEGARLAGYSRLALFPMVPGALPDLAPGEFALVLVAIELIAEPVREILLGWPRRLRCPVAVWVDQADRATLQAAIEANIGAVIVEEPLPARVKPVAELATLRFAQIESLRGELEAAQQRLAERKVIDRAKGILMEVRKISEEDAYSLLRRTAMNENKRIADVAKSIITAAELLT
jgi:response regulator NasT